MNPEHPKAEPLTRLGGAVLAVLTARHRRRQPSGTNWLYDVILGGQDGLVNILGIILGVIAGGGSNRVLIATGFAAAITESISMGAVGYTISYQAVFLLTAALALFMGFSKIAVALGAFPDDFPTTVIPTPGDAPVGG